jgi:diguanylate cyclase (GGDEF)-like protein
MNSPGGSARTGPGVSGGVSFPSGRYLSRKWYLFRRIGLSVLWALLFLLLNRPEIIVLKQFGSSVWYPAAGFALFYILMLGPAYAIVAALSSSLAGILIYNDPLLCWSGTVGAAAFGACYGLAVLALRRRWRIDLGLHRRQDVIRYLCMATMAAAGSSLIGTLCLAADGSIRWADYWHAAFIWLLGDEIGLFGITPLLIIYALPAIQKRFLASGDVLGQGGQDFEKRKSLAWHLEAVAQVASIPAALWVMFNTAGGRFELIYLNFIPIIWMAMRQGMRRVVIGLVVLNFGVVIALHFWPPYSNEMIKVSILMLAFSATGLIAGAATDERTSTEENLRAEKAFSETVIQDLTVAREAAQFQATHDALTGLWNRTAILAILERELDRGTRTGNAPIVMIMDLDHFKQINDNYGHLAGDAVLREVGARLASAVRSYDWVGRYGGEEFLVVLGDCNAADAGVQAERVRQAIASPAIMSAAGEIAVTISIGVAGPHRILSAHDVLASADAALYRAKQQGRNRVEVATISPTSSPGMGATDMVRRG